MRETRQSGSEGGGLGYSTEPPYPYQQSALSALKTRGEGQWPGVVRIVAADGQGAGSEPDGHTPFSRPEGPYRPLVPGFGRGVQASAPSVRPRAAQSAPAARPGAR